MPVDPLITSSVVATLDDSLIARKNLSLEVNLSRLCEFPGDLKFNHLKFPGSHLNSYP